MIFVKGGKYKASFTDVKQEVFDIEVSKYLVTQDLWQEIMGNNPSYFKGNKKPVECISWWDCLEFCNKLSEKYNLKPVYDLSQKDKEIFKIIHLDGEIVEESKSNFKNTEGFRLPTELEWEWFASGGQKAIDEKTFNCKYSGSNKIDEVAWYAKNFCCEDEETKGTHIVGIKKANQLGLYDCIGNVWEWCFDIKSSIEKESRRLRGGSWYNANFDCTVLGRFFNEAKNLNYSIGFRIVRTI
ncbi:formylglycine-generating enzyme family protein [Fusobacterium polymorphum]|uniref:formylglycine-generating enzyme family protein n=1 Tax=Fusobacterium nucleatum subsp. polymorphum TaxID=76857 RepID=UPI003008FB96